MDWFKSSYSFSNSNCVEAARLRDGIAVRDSKNTDGPVLRFSQQAWATFVSQVKHG